MPLFKILPATRQRSGQLQQVYCPRCKSVLEPKTTHISGDGATRRRVETTYQCVCKYELTAIETYPVINMAIKDEE